MSDWLRKKLNELEAAEGYVMPEGTAALTDELLSGKLDANENAFLPKEFVASLTREVAAEIDPRFYPMEEYETLVQVLSNRIGVPREQIVLGSGSDQLIDIVARTFLESGSKAVSIAPTYSFYRLRSLLIGAEFLEIPLRTDFSLDVDGILGASSDARVLFLCSPNNPTGNQFPLDSIEFLLRAFPGIVVVDEAYVEFADYSVADLVRSSRNLIVLRTLSKAFGLAGMRLGYMIADSALSRLLGEKVQYPYPLNTFALKLAARVLQADDVILSSIQEMKKERERLSRELSLAGANVFPSKTNFILFQAGEVAGRIHKTLARQGVFIKYIGEVIGLKGCLRVTVGKRDVNDRIIETVAKCLR